MKINMSHKLIVFVLLLQLTSLATAFAHIEKTVEKYKIEVGWLSEPPLTNERNGVEIVVENRETKQPVEGLEKTLKVSLSFGGKTLLLELIPQGEDKPGRYVAAVIPTRPGTYTVIITGTIEVTRVNLSVDIEKVSEKSQLQFPEPEPSVTDLQKTMNQLDSKISRLNEAVQSTAQIAANAQKTSDSAVSYGLAGTALGILGIIVGAVSLVRSRK